MKKARSAEVLKFAENVRQIRTDKGLTQEQLAEAADLNPQYVGFIERGLKSPSVKNISKLYKYNKGVRHHYSLI
jgi:transcriptional regulator with XRE-family HTH domain